MSLWSAITRLLTVLAVAGLVSGPLAGPAKASAMADMAAAAMAVADPATMPADHMDCCDPLPWAPDQADMKTCPFATICTGKLQQGTATANFSQNRLAIAVTVPLFDDRPPDVLAASPLGHPPKA